jgi:hypothetical protein
VVGEKGVPRRATVQFDEEDHYERTAFT